MSMALILSGLLLVFGLLIFRIGGSFGRVVLSLGLIWSGAMLNLVMFSREGIGGFFGQGAAVLLAILLVIQIGVFGAICSCQKKPAEQDMHLPKRCLKE